MISTMVKHVTRPCSRTSFVKSITSTTSKEKVSKLLAQSVIYDHIVPDAMIVIEVDEKMLTADGAHVQHVQRVSQTPLARLCPEHLSSTAQ